MVVAVVVSGMALIAAIFGVGLGFRAVDEAGSGSGSGAAGAAGTASVHLSEFAITPASVELASGGTLDVHNDGAVTHNLAIEGTDLMSPMLGAGETAHLALTGLAPGTYTLICQVAGHADAGMRATLVVTAGAGGTAAATGTEAMPGMTATGGAAKMTTAEMDAAMEKSIKAFPAKTQGVGGQDLAPKVLADGTKQFDLTSSVVKWEVEPGRIVEAWAYNGTVPGPTLRAEPGDKVQVVLHNQLPESTAIHFHGLLTPNAADGVPFITQLPIKPGETYTYSFVAQATPAVGMYHSHENAVAQVPDGLAGTFLIGHLPVPAGVTVAQEQTMMLNDSGAIGFSLNGKSFPATAPVVAKQGDWVEVHYLNEGMMAHPMHLHGVAQLVIAKDGYPVPQPYQADTINVAPGERYTVLVHATEVGTWAWHCHILSHAERADGMFGMVTALVVT
jgi:FtsP/CotA-like multicopper oxidase with cupredoxin domain